LREKDATIWGYVLYSPTKKPNRIPIDRKKISEALLADRLGLNNEWIESAEQIGEVFYEYYAPTELPRFIRSKLTLAEIDVVEADIERLVSAGCRRPISDVISVV
jgi:hypothetical protein